MSIGALLVAGRTSSGAGRMGDTPRVSPGRRPHGELHALTSTPDSEEPIHRRFGYSYQTAWTWPHKIRSVMDRSEGVRLDGIVEMDETYVGGEDPADKKGRSVAGKKTPVIAAVEDRGKVCGRLRLEFAGGATKEDIKPFVERIVAVGSTVSTDGLASYNVLDETGHTREKHVVGNGKNAPKVLLVGR